MRVISADPGSVCLPSAVCEVWEAQAAEIRMSEADLYVRTQ